MKTEMYDVKERKKVIVPVVSKVEIKGRCFLIGATPDDRKLYNIHHQG